MAHQLPAQNEAKSGPVPTARLLRAHTHAAGSQWPPLLAATGRSVEAADVAPSCITLPCPLLWVHWEAGAEGEPFGHKQGLRLRPSEFYVCFSVLKYIKKPSTKQREPSRGGRRWQHFPFSRSFLFFQFLTSPLQFLPLPVERWVPHHGDRKAPILMREAVTILNNCFKTKPTKRMKSFVPQLRYSATRSTPPHQPPRSPCRRSSPVTRPPWQKSLFTFVTCIFSAS